MTGLIVAVVVIAALLLALLGRPIATSDADQDDADRIAW